MTREDFSNMTESIINDAPAVSEEVEAFTSAFESRFGGGDAAGPSWLFPLRKAALARFAERGIPTVSDEDWRFTNLAALRRLPFRPVAPGTAGGSGPGIVAGPLAGLNGPRLVFVNGIFQAGLSDLSGLPDGVVFGSIAEALESSADLLEPLFARIAVSGENAFGALNTAFFEDGVFLHVGRGVRVEQPLHVVYWNEGPVSGSVGHPRNLFLVETGASVTVTETLAGGGSEAFVVNSVTEADVASGGRLEFVRFQDLPTQAFHFAGIHLRLERDASGLAHSISNGGRIARSDLRLHLAGEGSTGVLNGLYLTGGEQLADHHMVVRHAAAHAESHEYFNGILDGDSRGVFHGRILVEPGAQKTDAKQTNKNLLLTDRATANTKPQLEIYADDVKCTHGATVGQLDRDAIFYLRARGIGEAEARRMLMQSFAGEIVDRIECEGVREALHEFVWRRLEKV